MHFPVAAALAGALDDWGQVSDLLLELLHQSPSILAPLHLVNFLGLVRDAFYTIL